MTREQAIIQLNKVIEVANPKTVEAIETAIKALEQQPCENAVSRQVVLDKIKEVCFSKEQKWVDFRVSQGSNGQRDFIINFIESLPSVQPKTGHWIPVEYPTGVKAFGIKEMTTVALRCSVCEKEVDISDGDFKLCPYCGAKMEET